MFKKFETLNNIYISKNNIINNLNIIKNESKKIVFPVLKSNAYWHWIKEIAKILKWQELKYIVADSYYETLLIHKVNKTPVLIIWYINHNNFNKMKLKNITLMMYDIFNIQKLWETKRKVKIHLKINTWMNRLWVKLDDLDEVLEVIKKYKNITLEWVYSHFSQADEIDNSFTNNQIEIFSKAIEKIKNAWFDIKYTHIWNSAWSIKNLDFCNATRAWLALYWVNPLSEKDLDFLKYFKLKPAFDLESTIIAINEVSAWEYVWYWKHFQAKKDMKIWVIPFWYFEWLERTLNNYFFEFNRQKVYLVWKVCMNMCMVDLTWIQVKVWDKISIISLSWENNFNALSKASGKIPYEVMVWINESIRRKIY